MRIRVPPEPITSGRLKGDHPWLLNQGPRSENIFPSFCQLITASSSQLPSSIPPLLMPSARSSQALSADWVPNNESGPLAKYPELLALERDADIPGVEYGAWERSKFKKLFATYPNIRDVYWKMILALWRLSRLEDDAESELWQDYFVAWMVRTIFAFGFALAEFRSDRNAISMSARSC